MPKFSVEGAYVVNCAIEPLVSLRDWPYERNSGLGGSAAWAILNGRDGVGAELDLGVGWQDPAIGVECGNDIANGCVYFWSPLCSARDGPVCVEERSSSEA